MKATTAEIYGRRKSSNPAVPTNKVDDWHTTATSLPRVLLRHTLQHSTTSDLKLATLPSSNISIMSDTASDTASSVGDIIEDASEADTTTFKCLFCEEQWGSVPAMFAHCQKSHSFDVEETIKQLGQS